MKYKHDESKKLNNLKNENIRLLKWVFSEEKYSDRDHNIKKAQSLAIEIVVAFVHYSFQQCCMKILTCSFQINKMSYNM